MRTIFLDANKAGAIEKAAELLNSGYLVAFPTDTLYGLGAAVTDAVAINRLYKAKNRPADKGIPILIAEEDDLAKVVATVPDAAKGLIERYWPGPLTLIVPKKKDLPALLSPNENLAVRIPDNEVARRFIAAAGGAVATSSANRSGESPARNAQEVMASLQGLAAAVLDGGPVRYGQASTIIDCTVVPPRILRAGALDPQELLSMTEGRK